MIVDPIAGIGILWFSSEMVIRKIGPIARFFGVKELIVTILGADVTLKSGEWLGLYLGISELTLGTLMFAFGTSLPKLAVAFAATMKKKAEVSIGEIYASNIFTALFVLGVVALISAVPVAPAVLTFDIPFFLFAGIVLQIFKTTGKKLVRVEAGIILILYVFFVLTHFLTINLSF